MPLHFIERIDYRQRYVIGTPLYAMQNYLHSCYIQKKSELLTTRKSIKRTPLCIPALVSKNCRLSDGDHEGTKYLRC
jgi:hypothetical protein